MPLQQPAVAQEDQRALVLSLEHLPLSSLEAQDIPTEVHQIVSKVQPRRLLMGIHGISTSIILFA